MSDGRNDAVPGGGKVRRLSDAVRRVRIAEAERTDAFADLHDAERARLAILAEELAGVFGEIPADDDYFLCQIGGGTPPRLWIDGTTHVMIGRDRRSYRFVKDTRLGRVVLLESTDVAAIADAVTDYIAERVVDRERAQESDLAFDRLRSVLLPRKAETTAAERKALAAGGAGEGAAARPAGAVAAGPAQSTGLWMLSAFLFGIAVGAIGLIAYAWFRATV